MNRLYAATAPLRRAIPVRQRKIAKFLAFQAAGLLGLQPSPSLRGLNKKFDQHIRPEIRPGFFVEAGGNDGFSQSNTFHLEKYHGWHGLLIEPIGWLADLAESFRKAPIKRVALGSFENAGSNIILAEDDLKTRAVNGTLGVKVPVHALSEILDGHNVKEVDFFSLDVEGFEAEVLRGIDFDRHLFHNILIETSQLKTLPFPWDKYEEPIKISHHDYLLKYKH